MKRALQIGCVIVCFGMSLGTLPVQAQEASSEAIMISAPDNDAILRETINSSSPYYYPKLFARYQQGDTTLTLQDYRHLYYGYVWRPEYKPFETSSARQRIPQILAKEKLSREDLQQMVIYGETVLRREPFDPSTLNYMIFAYGMLGDTLKERIEYHHLQGVLDAISSSGTGLKEKSPWHITYFSHVTDFLASESLRGDKERVISRTVAYVPLVAKVKRVKGVYFDFSRIYWQKPDRLPEKRSAGWEFNGIPLKKRSIPQISVVEE